MMLRPSYLDLINVVNKEAEPGKAPAGAETDVCYEYGFLF